MRKILILLCITLSLSFAKSSKGTISKGVYAKLQKSQEFIVKKEHKKALTILNSIVKTSENSYEKSYALQYIANIYIEKDNYKKVSSLYEKIIKLEAFEKDNLDRIKFSLSRIYLSLEKYKRTIALSLGLLNNSKVNRDTLLENLIYSYYYQNKFRKTLSYTKELFKTVKKPKESIYQILYSAHIELKDYHKAIDTLDVMVKRWHKNETYWLQLISLYQEVKKYKKSLATFELAYKKDGIKKDNQTLYFANVLLQNNMYQKAAILLEDGIKKGLIKEDKKIFETLVSSYLNARQTKEAIRLLNTSSYGKSPKFALLLGNLYYAKLEYKNAIRVLKHLKIKKNTRKDGEKYILLALSYNELDNKKQCHHNLKAAYHNKHEKKRALSISKSLQIRI